MEIRKQFFGVTHEGQTASRYTLVSGHGMEVDVSDFGALILAIRLKVAGEVRDVALGFADLEGYYAIGTGLGAYVGRNANRIGGARVTIDGIEYRLEKNDGENNLHSGLTRSHCQFYDAALGEDAGSVWVELRRVSPHLEQGFPGNLDQVIRYTLTDQNELVLSYRMVSDKATVINPTNHSYFNLAGHGGGSVLSHKMVICADQFLPTDAALIPTGEKRSVEGTPFDFRQPHTIGERIEEDYEPLVLGLGYDHNYCLREGSGIRQAGWLESPDGKVRMTIYTDLGGMQVYTGNFLAGEQGKDGAVYAKRSGICFETQFYPNACNTPSFPTSIFPAGKVCESKTIYRFEMK